MQKSILLISFFHHRGIGVKYLYQELKQYGYKPYILYFKEFKSFNPGKISETEFRLLDNLINEIAPQYIGLSVMSSIFVENIIQVNNRIKNKFDISIIWGGFYPTLFPEEALKYCDYVIRGEGEQSLVELISTLNNHDDLSKVSNLVMKDENSYIIKNPLRPLLENLDELGYPEVEDDSIFYIENNKLLRGDQKIEEFTYETIASRGCPFACSYCNSIAMKKMYKGKGKYVRTRSVSNVMEELKKVTCSKKHIISIIFWDEIFPDDEEWIEEFKERYKKEIGIPFRIWGHPLKVKRNNIENLVEAGLYSIEMGIQSGSYRVRKDIFNRSETQEDILNATRILSETKVPRVVYDYIIIHSFENLEDLKETFNLFANFVKPFELQPHGLMFLPGTEIVNKALEKGIISQGEYDKIKQGSFKEQAKRFFWEDTSDRETKKIHAWEALIYLTQFSSMQNLLKILADEVEKGNLVDSIIYLKKLMKPFSKYRVLNHKGKMLIKSSRTSNNSILSYRVFEEVVKKSFQILNKNYPFKY